MSIKTIALYGQILYNVIKNFGGWDFEHKDKNKIKSSFNIGGRVGF